MTVTTSRLWQLLVAALALTACADRQRLNPLDPSHAPSPLDLADPLDALAGDGSVELRWDFTRFDDVAGVRLYREGGGADLVRQVGPDQTGFVDADVANGVLYRYRLALVVAGEGELAIAGEPLATPGPERPWVADAGQGLVWRLTPDGRRPLFAQGRFPQIAAVALDEREGTCWVSDGRLGGLSRITPQGQLERVGAALATAGALAIDGAARRGWVADGDGHAVYRFDVAQGADTLALVELDAHFRDPARLAPSPDGGVWVADRGAGRVALFDDRGRLTAQWLQVEDIVDLDAAGRECCRAWALADGGRRLLGLAPGEATVEVSLPYAEGRGLDAGPDGGVWVVGETDVAAIDAGGQVLALWREAVADGRDVAVDARNGQVWVLGSQELRKIAVDGSYQTQLTGLLRAVAVAVSPGP